MASKTEVAVERRNLSPAALYEHAVRREEAAIVSTGALTAETGKHTGRSPKDKFFVKESPSQDAIWWHPGNQPIPSAKFDQLLARTEGFAATHEVFTQDVFACADPRYRLRVRVVTELAWHSLFARTLFIGPNADELMDFEPDFTVMSMPSMKADPQRDGTHSETFILVNLGQGIVIIGGTGYAGEIKKSIFTALNYLLPAKGVFPMHCSANVGSGGSDVALFFGLSGTGKTTLSADPSRRLIGDDEHGWSDSGGFNFEGGCYAGGPPGREAEPPLLPLGLHGQGGRHRTGRGRTRAHLQHVLRLAVPRAPARALRRHADRAGQPPPCRGLDAEHRMGRRAVW